MPCRFDDHLPVVEALHVMTPEDVLFTLYISTLWALSPVANSSNGCPPRIVSR
jgi:hypothetical protein